MRRRIALQTAVAVSALGTAGWLLKQRLSFSRPAGLRLSAAQLDILLGSLTEGVIIFGAGCRVVRHNAAAQTLLGIGPAEIARWDVAALRSLVSAAGDPLAPEFFGVERVFATGAAIRDVFLGIGPHHDRRWLAANVVPIGRTRDARPEFVVLSLSDITHRTTHDREAGAFVRRLRQLHHIASTPAESDRDRIDFALRFALEELELDQAYLGVLDRTTNELVIENVVARDRPPTYAPGHRYPADQTLIGRIIDSSYVLAAPDVARTRSTYGVRFRDEWQSYIAVAVSFAGEPYGVIGFKGFRVRDRPFSPIDIELVQVTGDLIAASVERETQRARLDALAFYDALTGLPNRVLFADRLTQSILSAKRHDTRFALLFLDLDDFKSVNDTLGHAAGDEVLRRFAASLTHVAREGDTIARLGGDEFVVLAPNIETERDALELAQRIRSNVARTETVDGQDVALSASIGISLFPDHGVDSDVLLARADAAMFAAKTQPKRGVRTATQ